MVKGKFCEASKYYEHDCIQVVYEKFRDKIMDYFINGVISNDEKIVKNEYFVLYWYKMERLSKVSKPNQFVPLLKKVTYKRKKQSSLISISKNVKLDKIIIKHNQANNVITQSMFGMIGSKGNLICLLFIYFRLLPIIGSSIRTAQIKKTRSNINDI